MTPAQLAAEDARQASREARIAQNIAERAAKHETIVKAQETWLLETKAHRERVEVLLQTIVDELRENRRISLARRR